MYPLIKISEHIALPTYLVIISLTYCACIFWLVRRMEKSKLPTKDGLDIALAIMVGGVVGARMLHVAYESPKYFINNPTEIFNIFNGGFVFYGGAITAFICALFVVKFKKLNFYAWADIYAPILPVGYAFGRVACFLNGCCYGDVCALPWAMKFPHIEHLRHPTQLYAALIELIIFVFIIFLDKYRGKVKSTLARWTRPSGQLFFTWITLHSLNRILMEIFRADYRGDFIFSLSISTWISVIVFFAAAHCLYHNKNIES